MKIHIILVLIWSQSLFAAFTCDGIVANQTDRDAFDIEQTAHSMNRAARDSFLLQTEKYLTEKHPEWLYIWQTPDQDEKYAIQLYTIGSYSGLNAQLREEKIVDMHLLRLTCSGLNKLDDFNGTVYRKVNRTPEQIKKIADDGTYGDLAFMSASHTKSVHFVANTLLTIHTTHGKNIESISYHHGEREVLLLPDSKFRVLSVREHAPDPGDKVQYEIELEEAVSP